MTAEAQTKTGYDHDDLRHVVITSTCFAFVLSTTAVAFRIISRKINGTGLFLDDILMLSALVSCTFQKERRITADRYSCLNMESPSLGLFVCVFSRSSLDQQLTPLAVLYNGLGTHIVYVKPDELVVYLKVYLLNTDMERT